MFEYRTLSSAMMSDKSRIEFIYEQVIRAINAFNNGIVLPDYATTQLAINNGDTTLANILIKNFSLI